MKSRKLRGKNYSFSPAILKPGQNLLSEISGELFEIQCEIEPAGAEEFGFTLRGTALTYNVKENKLLCADKKAKVRLIEGKVKLQILVDRTSIEIFANDGWESMFMCFPLDSEKKSLEMFTRGGDVKVRNLNVRKLKSIWSGAEQ